ncbi:putative MFS family arabinose efflux permease [Dongia mobilis]|uniref:Putative MFS family arabinose efflux permease n=1 Tax=Dongia mobilis TaxID=578943 RepID=A0A4R6WKY3_9PROT|nr:putative MFS family arabinose efflux permease [Dongia mobilis]
MPTDTTFVPPLAGPRSPVHRPWHAPVTQPGPVLFATLFTVDSIARAIVAPVLPLEALRLLGSARDVSIMVTIVGIAGVVAALILPGIILRWRPRATYLLSIALLGIASLAMMTAHIAGFGLGWMLRAMAAAGLLGLLNIYIAAFIGKKALAKSEPLRTFFSATAWAGGPFLGIRLYEIDPALPFVVSAGTALLLFLYFRRLRLQAPVPGIAQRSNPVANIRRYFGQKRLTLAWILNFGRETWWVTLFTYAPIYLVQNGMPQVAAGNLLSACTAMLFVALVFGWLGRRIGLRRFIAGAFLWVSAATFGVVWFHDRPDIASALLIVSAVGAVSLDSVAVVTFLRAVRSFERPQMTMVFSIFRDAAALIPPAIFAVLLTFFPLWTVFLVNAGFALICAGLALKLPRRL